MTQVVLSTPVMFLSGSLLIHKGPTMCLFELFPGDPPVLYISTSFYPSTSPGATNTDVLISILLHCLFARSNFTSLILNGEGSSSGFQDLKQGQSRTGPCARVRSDNAVIHPLLPNQKTYLMTSHTLFKDQMDLRKQFVLVTHSFFTKASHTQYQNITHQI